MAERTSLDMAALRAQIDEALAQGAFPRCQALLGELWRARGDAANVDEFRARRDAARAHALGVAHQFEALFDLGVGDEGALSLASVDALFDLELGQRLAHGGP